MNGTFKTEKFAADKIALFGLFIVALFIARLVITSRSAIVLSAPIVLEHSGLSLSIPTGRGWQSESRWLYEDNGFTLNSAFVPRRTSPTTLVHCRYLLVAEDVGADELFQQRALKIEGAIKKTGQINTGSLILDWAHIKKQKALFDIFFGTVRLPNNRRLDIEVAEAAGDTKTAEQLFGKIMESLSFEDNQLLSAGAEIVTAIKDIGLNGFLYNQTQQDFFLIQDKTRRAIGFTTDVLVESQQHGPLNIQGAGLLYMQGRYGIEQATFFQSDNSFDEFEWRIERVERTNRTGTTIIAEYPGRVTVRRLDTQAEETSYLVGPATIPAVLLELVLSQMLDSGYEKIVVDVIKTDGTVAPMVVSRTEAKDRADDSEDVAYVLMTELLDGRGGSELVLLDSQKRILGSILQQDNVYIIERTDMETILRLFPQQEDYILKKSEALEQNQL